MKNLIETLAGFFVLLLVLSFFLRKEGSGILDGMVSPCLGFFKTAAWAVGVLWNLCGGYLVIGIICIFLLGMLLRDFFNAVNSDE